jgi:hypothetical protein
MKRAFRVTNLLCILLVLGFLFGCSKDDSPVKPDKPDIPDPELLGAVGVFADEAGTNPTIVDNGGIVTVYVVHKLDTDGATGCQFKINAPVGWTLLTEQVEFPLSIGDARNGIAIVYGQCKTGSVHLMTLRYDTDDIRDPDDKFTITPDPNSVNSPEMVEVVDCQNQLREADSVESPVVQQ